ncbi:hypothetical protein JHK85_048924 [Glycine max]|nr:hypothetical protein JHK85_048924 [Glycine max]
MASSSRTKSSGPVLRSSSSSSSLSHSNSFCSYSTSNAPFHSPSSSFFRKPHSHVPPRSTSPTRVNLFSAAPLPSHSVRFALDRSISPNRTVSSHVIAKHRHVTAQKKSCMCSPTTHPGSFRCSLHKNSHSAQTGSFPSNRLNMRRSAMKNSLVRIGGVEGEWVKRALTALIRPSSHQQRRRTAFEPRQSRLSIMLFLNRRNIRISAAGDGFSPIASPENLEDFVGVDLRGWTLDSENSFSFRHSFVTLCGGFVAAVEPPLSFVHCFAFGARCLVPELS